MANARQQKLPKALIRRTLESARREIEQIERKFHRTRSRSERRVQHRSSFDEGSHRSDQERRWTLDGPSRTGSDCGHERAEKRANGSHAGSSPGRSSEVRREVAPECDVRDAPQGSDHVREERQGTRQIPLAGLNKAIQDQKGGQAAPFLRSMPPLDTRSLAPIPSSPRDFPSQGRATS